MFSVDIDVGGTLTDGIFSDGQRVVCAKVDSTPHDLTVCLFDCLTQGSTQLGFGDLASFLHQVELLRWSTTITSNVLAELRGPKIGLIVSKGHEKDLYGTQSISPALNRVISEGSVIGISGSEGVLPAVRSLLESGVRRICISLKGALQNPTEEQRIKQAIEEQYPDHFLGSVPVLTGSDICKNTDDMTRTCYAIVNAYTHSALAATLFKAEDELRYVQGYSRAFLISHINGGVAGVSKTRAIDTMESGPILGLYGASHLSKIYGVPNVIALDVGGTTAKLGVIQNGEPIYSQESDLLGIPVRTSLPYLRSIALGGGSVVASGERGIQLGPESMGSFPGPVCYGLGGEHATLTDAFLTAGFINPEYFLGGTRQLDLELAREAIDNSIARPRRISIQEACRAVVDRAFTIVAGMIAHARAELKQDLGGHALFAYGGNGGLFACGVAELAGLESVFMFDLGPVFSAFGSSVSDICHIYERAIHLRPQREADLSGLNRAIKELHATGLRDLRGEGISPEGADCSLELEFSRPGRDNLSVGSAVRTFDGVDELRRLFAETAAAEDTVLELIRIRVKKAVSRPALVEKPVQAADASAALVGKRPVAHGSSGHDASIYKWESLRPGNVVHGCSILEANNSTYLVPEGWELTLDRFGNGQLKCRSRKTLQAPISKHAQETPNGN
ncbi:MAG TPA: hydantoinase/oxoprolinase family protein [Terriglobales bacterium]